MKPISFIPAAIRSLDPECEFAYFDGTDEIRIDKSAKNITEIQIRAEAILLEVEYDSQEYARKREAEYPSVQECVHAILDDTLDALQAKRAEIKTKYPKGG